MNISKDPQDIVYYTIDLSEWLNDGELVTSFEPSSNTENTLLDYEIGSDSKSVTTKLGGGSDGSSIIVTYKWGTNLTRSKTKRLIMTIKKGYL
jgi:hypothetical protein